MIPFRVTALEPIRKGTWLAYVPDDQRQVRMAPNGTAYVRSNRYRPDGFMPCWEPFRATEDAEPEQVFTAESERVT